MRFKMQPALLVVVFLAASIPVLANVVMGQPLNAHLIIFETIALASIGLGGIYITMKGTERYDYVIKEETMLHNSTRQLAAQLEHNIRMKDLFVDIIAHDLINPVGIIKNYTELMLDTESDETKRTNLQSIKRNTVRLAEIIRDAKTVAKLEGMKKVEFAERDLTSTLKSTVSDFEGEIKSKGLGVEFLCPGECKAMVNPILDEVFYNLMSNAVKYSPEKGKITISTGDAGGTWRISIKDNGPGVHDEDKEKIFERFKRLKKGEVKGTGLGLTIVKRIVDIHSGRVWVEDNPEGGSIFCLDLPKKQPLKLVDVDEMKVEATSF